MTTVIELQDGPVFDDYRKLYGLETETALAEKMGISRTTLWKVLKKDQPITLDFANALVAAFDHKLDFWTLFRMVPLNKEEKSAPATCPE